jgi:ribosomal protein S27AE
MKYVKVCPKCSGRIRVHHPNIFSKMGFLPIEYRCEKCGYTGKYFLEVPVNELEGHRKLLKGEKKE